MYYAITKAELWTVQRALESGEDIADAIEVLEGVASGQLIDPPPCVTDDEDREVIAFASQEGC